MAKKKAGKAKKINSCISKSTIQEVQVSRTGGQIALTGFTYQFLYSCYLILSEIDENTVFYLEGIEDIDKIRLIGSDECNTHIQLKYSTQKQDASFLKDVLKNYLEVYLIDKKRNFNLIYDFQVAKGNLGKLFDSSLDVTLDGETVLYGSASELRATLEYDFSQEKNYSYKGLSMDEIIHHLAIFVSTLWQNHIFGEGNTRTTAVFFIKYLRTLGFDATNDIFAENAWYFRNALVRANYNNLTKGIHETTEYLELFLENLLCGEHHELHNRTLHVSGRYKHDQKSDIKTKKPDIETKKPDIHIWEIYGESLEAFTSKTVVHIQSMYNFFGVNVVFGRSDMQKITKLGASRASDLLKDLVHAQIIEAVAGYGKGKYKFCKK